LAIGEAFGKLQDGGEREACRGFCRLAAHREERGELRVMVDISKPVGHLHVDIAMWERGTGNALGFFRDRRSGLRV
jgi:hypothetical protein